MGIGEQRIDSSTAAGLSFVSRSLVWTYCARWTVCPPPFRTWVLSDRLRPGSLHNDRISIYIFHNASLPIAIRMARILLELCTYMLLHLFTLDGRCLYEVDNGSSHVRSPRHPGRSHGVVCANNRSGSVADSRSRIRGARSSVMRQAIESSYRSASWSEDTRAKPTWPASSGTRWGIVSRMSMGQEGSRRRVSKV